MTIEITILLSAVSVAAALVFGIRTQGRNSRSDAQKDAAQMTTVIVKLENISMGIADIKSELANVKSDVYDARERLAQVESSAKQAHKRVDSMEHRLEKDTQESDIGKMRWEH